MPRPRRCALLLCLAACTHPPCEGAEAQPSEESFAHSEAVAYSEQEAVELASLATAAYCDGESVASWSCGKPCIPGLESARIVSNPSTTAFAFVGRLRGECLVAFRGSQSAEQWTDNMKNVEQTRFPGCSFDGEECLVGLGYLHQFESISAKVHDSLMAIGCNPPDRITLTGHSLGGVLASMAALDLSNMGYVPAKLYTFGQTRPGNRAFAKVLWDELRHKPFYRVTVENDPAVYVPARHELEREWMHAGREIYYHSSTSEGYRSCELKLQGDPLCAFNKSTSEISSLAGICKANYKWCGHFRYMSPRMPFLLVDLACDRSTQFTFV